jgi:crotonobetainyl-CoA:carnitine CoA-transferase CaiB-like acyl-CoA transferase
MLNTNRQRVTNREEMNRVLAAAVAEYEIAALRGLLDAAGVPNAPVLDLGQVLAEPQFAAVGILQELADGTGRQVGLPLSFNGEKPPLRTNAPELGEANAVVFQ